MSTQGGGTSPIGRVGFLTSGLVASTYSKPAAATQYSLGDIIGNSATAASVTPITFSSAARFANGSGRTRRARCTLTAASGTIVYPEFDLLVFRPVTSIPFADAGYPADNAVCDITAAAYKQLVAVFTFQDDAWRNQAGGTAAAGAVAWQAVNVGANIAPFDLDGLADVTSLRAIMQAQNTWNPGNVAYAFDFSLDVEQD